MRGAGAWAEAACLAGGAGGWAVCSDDLMFTARIKAVDATATAHA